MLHAGPGLPSWLVLEGGHEDVVCGGCCGIMSGAEMLQGLLWPKAGKAGEVGGCQGACSGACTTLP